MKKEIDVEEIVDKYADMVYKIALSYLRNIEDAEDIVQEVFIEYINNTKPFKNEEHQKHWIVRVTLNKCFNEKYSSRNKRNILVSSFDKFENSDVEYNYVLDIIENLGNKYKSVFELFYIHDFSTKSISKVLNISEVAVRTRLKRARNEIRKILKEGE